MTDKAKEIIDRLNNHVKELPFAEEQKSCYECCKDCLDENCPLSEIE